MSQDTNLNMKMNMKANFGITYQEDSYREVGPTYIEKYAGKPTFKGRLSRE